MVRIYTVAYASIHLAGLMDASDEIFVLALEESWIPGAEATRYGRTWRISAPHEAGDNRRGGRIGFFKPGELQTLDWDEEAQDFRRGVATSGVIVPFVIDIRARRVAFQLESGQVRPNSFTGALQDVLNEHTDTYEWAVTPLVHRMPYEDWVREIVDVVTEFTFRLERPNPHYGDRAHIREMIEDLRLYVATVKGQGANIDTDDDLFQEYMDHVRHNYGSAKLKGRERSGQVSEWMSAQGGSVPAQSRVESEAEDEVPEEELVRALDTLGVATEADEDERLDEEEEYDETT
ncbi:MAG: hypothetical protein M3O70_25695 [Actinomycetota bacterium]|nr:hypothetical protein [Actinomycetota bacterium]